jgi:hypothetical protein
MVTLPVGCDELTVRTARLKLVDGRRDLNFQTSQVITVVQNIGASCTGSLNPLRELQVVTHESQHSATFDLENKLQRAG